MKPEVKQQIKSTYKALTESGMKSMEAKRILMLKYGFRSHNTIAKALHHEN